MTMTAQKRSEVMYLRVPSEVKSDIEQLAESRYGGRRFTTIVNDLLRYFLDIGNPALQDEILGYESTTLRADATVRQAWADHAFLRGHWEWACDEYLELAKMSDESSGTWRFAQFRLGYCWTEVALELKRRALVQRRNSRSGRTDDVKAMFEEVHEALSLGLTFYKWYNEKDPPGRGRAVVEYNMACVYALMAESLAQASCECEDVLEIDRRAGIAQSSPAEKPAAKQAEEQAEEQAEKQAQKRANEYKEHMRRCEAGKGPSTEIKEFADGALDILERLKEKVNDGGYDFMFEYVLTDTDFAFLRTSRTKEFKTAIRLNPRHKGTAYKKVLQKTQDLVRSKAERSRSGPPAGRSTSSETGW